MGYAVTNPPRAILNLPEGNTLWLYKSPNDSLATMDTAGYITNARAIGMKKGDLIFVQLWSALPTTAADLDTAFDASPTVTFGIMGVKGISAAGAADLTDAAAIATNTD